MQEIFNADVSVNVHFIPVPGMSFYKKLGFELNTYKTTVDNFSREITLPVFYDLSDENIKTVVNAVIAAVNKVC